jgi:predicted dehydrogenase
VSIRWGVIGTGNISERFVPDLQVTSLGNVTGVWGRSQERTAGFAEQFDIPFATTDRAELLARDDIDAVYIATPMQTHRDIAIESLAAGKHVLIEKPMAMSTAEVDEIFAAAQAAGRFAMEAMWMRFNPVHLDVFRRIGEGVLGEIRSVRASFGMPFRAGAGKATVADGGSIWLDRGIYAVTLAQWALGEPIAIHAESRFMSGTDVAGHATLEFEGGAFAHIACSGVDFLDLSAAISGTQGWIGIDPMFWAATSGEVRAGSMEALFHTPDRIEHPREGNGFRPMLVSVQSALAAGHLQHPDHDHQATRSVALTLDSIRRQGHGPEEPAAR